MKKKENTDIPALKILIVCLFGLLLAACGKTEAPKSTETIEPAKQDSVFRHLMAVTDNAIPESARQDSLAFLLLPLEATCPSCRKKAIDSIIKWQSHLPANHYIILSADGGRKTISAFFRDRGAEIPVIVNRLFLDSTNLALAYNLSEDKPTMYYTAGGKAHTKVAAVPNTVKVDLRKFFSGY